MLSMQPKECKAVSYVLYAVSIVLIMLGSVYTAAGSSFTTQTSWHVAADFTPASDSALWLTFAEDSTNTEDSLTVHSSPLAAVWWYDTESLFPVWRFSLYGATHVLPQRESNVFIEENTAYMHLSTTSAPKPDHEYRLTLSYNGTDGAVGVQLRDETGDSTVIDRSVALSSSPSFSVAQAVLFHNNEYTALEHTAHSYYYPLGVNWQLIRERPGANRMYMQQRSTPIEAGDDIVVQLDAPTAVTGRWQLRLQHDDYDRVIAQLPQHAGRHTVSVWEVPDDIFGPARFILEYEEDDRIVVSHTAEAIVGRVTAVFAEPTAGVADDGVHITGHMDTTFPLHATITWKTTVQEIVWDEESGRYTTVPLPEYTVQTTQHMAAEAGAKSLPFAYHVPLPQRAGTFRLTHRPTHDVPRDITFTVENAEHMVHTDTLGYVGEASDAFTFSVATYNVYGDYEWPDRAEALHAVVQLIQPDILGVQELKPGNGSVIADALPNHRRVDDRFIGWLNEGNIFWSTKTFDLVEYGAEDIGICEPWRRLFWVRLQPKQADETILVANVHLTWDGHACIQQEGKQRRERMAQAAADVLKTLAKPDEAVILLGDMNESGAALDVFRNNGFIDSVGADGQPVPYTYPADPSTTTWRGTIDWQFHQGPLQVLRSNTIDFMLDDIAPSDHKPVLVTYRLQ